MDKEETDPNEIFLFFHRMLMEASQVIQELVEKMADCIISTEEHIDEEHDDAHAEEYGEE